MKSLGLIKKEDSTFQTFADLIFCTLVVLLLFVLVLALEVNQRVRADTPAVDEVEVVEAAEIAKLSNEEIEELSRTLQEQQKKNEELLEQIEENKLETERLKAKVGSRLAAMNGEQRFTGARQPAGFNIAYNTIRELFYFAPSKDVEHADRRKSGESDLVFLLRKRAELQAIASSLRNNSRGYTPDEAKAIFSAFSKYQAVVPTPNSYYIETSEMKVYYHTLLCDYLVGGKVSEARVVRAILDLAENDGPDSDLMYPKCEFQVLAAKQKVRIGGVELSPNEAKGILLSLDGRGAILDLEGIDGKAPDWLREQVLAPSGYISKTPKIPEG